MYLQKKITVPAAGVNTIIPVGGCAVTVEKMPSYRPDQEVPILKFDDENGSPQPLYVTSTYVNQGGKEFRRIVIEGTAASAGDEIVFLISDVPIQPYLNINYVQQQQVIPGVSFFKAGTDVAQTLSPAEYNVNGLNPTRLTIAADVHPVSIAFGVNPNQSGNGILIGVGEVYIVEGLGFIQTLRFINRTAGDNAVVTFTAEV
jgi:hypothetical protein